MRIAILSDFHLGYGRFRDDAFRQAEEALSKAASMADVMIIPGDIFDSRAPEPDVIAEAINLFRNLSRREWKAKTIEFSGEGQTYTSVPIIAIPGTHERRAKDAADPVDILGLAGLLVDISNATAIIESEGEKLAVRGIGGIADERFRQVVCEINPVPVKGMFNVFVFHESLYELLPFNEDFMRLEELPQGFDLYVCGHIHGRVEATVHGKKLLIPGSTVLTQLKEGEQEAKGFYVYDTKSMSYEYVRINSRRFVMQKIDVGKFGSGEVVSAVEAGIESMIGGANDRPVIRVVIEGNIPRGSSVEMDLNDMARRYEGRAVVEVSKSGITEDAVRSVYTRERVAFEKMSVKDYGIGIFLEKIKESGTDTGRISPVELLDILSSEQSKEKAVAKALEELLES